MLYSYRNSGEDITQAVSISGRTYTELPNAFRYRREFTSNCSCRRPGQSWADALKNSDDSTTLEQGDIVVTEQNSKALSQAPQKGAAGKPKGGAAQPKADPTPAESPTRPAPISRRAPCALSDRRSSRRIEFNLNNRSGHSGAAAVCPATKIKNPPRPPWRSPGS